MKSISVAAGTIALLSIVTISFAPALAQQKTVKACEEEWRANKDANQAKGITEKAYVEQCHGQAGATVPKVEAAPPKATKTAAPTAAEKTVKACEEEWRANKAANQAKGITEKAYVEQCHGGGAIAAPPAAPAAPAKVEAPAAAPPPPARTTTAPPAAPAAPAAAKPTGANQYSTEAQAKARCGSGIVVWANLDSKIYHFAGHPDYGHTKEGAYMCEKDALAQDIRAAKNEKRPQ